MFDSHDSWRTSVGTHDMIWHARGRCQGVLRMFFAVLNKRTAAVEALLEGGALLEVPGQHWANADNNQNSPWKLATGGFHWGGQPLAPYLHEPRPGWSPACSTGGAEFDEPERKTGRQISKWDIRTYWKMCVYKPGISFGMRCKMFACSNSVILLGTQKKTVFWRIRPGSAYILSVNTFHNRVPTVFGGWWFPSSKATMSARTLPIHKISHSALDPLLLDYVGLNLVWFWDWVRYEPNSPNVGES